MQSTSKGIIQFVLALMLLVSTSLNVASASTESEVETVNDMRVLEEQASAADLPVLLLFTAEECDYCEAIRAHYLEPMIRTGQYASSLLFRQLYVDEFRYLRNRRGELVGGDQMALKFDVEVTPTILFIDASGKELAQRIVGLSGADYFDKTLSTHISQAQSNYQK